MSGTSYWTLWEIFVLILACLVKLLSSQAPRGRRSKRRPRGVRRRPIGPDLFGTFSLVESFVPPDKPAVDLISEIPTLLFTEVSFFGCNLFYFFRNLVNFLQKSVVFLLHETMKTVVIATISSPVPTPHSSPHSCRSCRDCGEQNMRAQVSVCISGGYESEC